MISKTEKHQRDIILVVDDQPNNLKVIASVLKEDYSISIANNGKNALKMLETLQPDLILLDIMMPDMNGYEVCRKIKSNEKTKHIPVIFLTAKSDVNDIVKAFDSGGIDYIIKPFNSQEVKVRVRNHLKLYHVEKKLNDVYSSLLNELDLAASVQQYLLPNWLSVNNDLAFSSTYKPYQKIGGDFFDYFQIAPHRYVTYVGDVSGHGVQEALIMTAVKSTINMLINNEKDNLRPFHIIERLNKLLADRLLRSNFITMIICLIDLEKNEIRYLNAGHPPLIKFSIKDRKTEIIKAKNSIPIGWLASYEYSEEEETVIKLEDDIAYLIYTDGIFECEDPYGEQLGIENLAAFINDAVYCKSCLHIPNIIKFKLIDLGYNINQDDFTIVSFQKSPLPKENIFRRTYQVQKLLYGQVSAAKDCSAFVSEKTNNILLASNIELIVKEYIKYIIPVGLKNKDEEIIGIEIAINEKVNLKFWFQGDEIILPGKNSPKQVIDSEFLKKNNLTNLYNLVKTLRTKNFADVNQTIITV